MASRGISAVAHAVVGICPAKLGARKSDTRTSSADPVKGIVLRSFSSYFFEGWAFGVRRRCNGQRRDIGNRLLEGVQLLSKRRDLLGKLFRLGLLGCELVLNDLQLVDGLLLSYLKPLRRLEKHVCDLLARRGGHSAGRETHPVATEAPNN